MVESLDNMTVMAAAPELLAELEKICSKAIECKMDDGPSMVDGLTWDDIIEARAAIAKAKGVQL